MYYHSILTGRNEYAKIAKYFLLPKGARRLNGIVLTLFTVNNTHSHKGLLKDL